MSTAEEKAAAKADKNIAGQRVRTPDCRRTFGRTQTVGKTVEMSLRLWKYLYCLLLEPDERAYQKLRMFKKP